MMINYIHRKVSDIHQNIQIFHTTFNNKNLEEIPLEEYLEMQSLLHKIECDINKLDFEFGKIETIANTSFNLVKQEFNLLIQDNLTKQEDISV